MPCDEIKERGAGTLGANRLATRVSNRLKKFDDHEL